MRGFKCMGVFVAIFAILSAAGCGGGAGTQDPVSQAKTANVFTVGTDAPPLPSVFPVK